MSFAFPLPAPSASDTDTYNKIKTAYDNVDVATLYWWKTQPISATNLAFVTSALSSPRVAMNMEIRKLIQAQDTTKLQTYLLKTVDVTNSTQDTIHPVNKKLIQDALPKIAQDVQDAKDKTAIEAAFAARDLQAILALLARTNPALSAANKTLAENAKSSLQTSGVVTVDDADAAGIQDAITRGDTATLYWYRDTKTPTISAANKQKIADYFASVAQIDQDKADKAKANELYDKKDKAGLIALRDRANPAVSADVKKYIQDFIDALTSGVQTPGFGPTLSQRDLDLAEFNKYKVENDLAGLKKMLQRTTPPIDDDIIAMIKELIALIEAQPGYAPDFEINKPGGVDTGKPKLPGGMPFISVETFGPSASMIMRAKAQTVPPKETIIGDSVVTPSVPPNANQGFLTDEGWYQLKNLAFNVAKYTGLYVAPAVLATVAYQYSSQQPDGTLLRAITELVPAPKSLPPEAATLQKTASVVGKVFGEVLPDILAGTTPGKPGGKIIEDIPGTLTGPTPKWYENLGPSPQALEGMEKVAQWALKDRELVNDIFPKAATVLERRGSGVMNLDKFPVYEVRDKSVGEYVNQSNGTVTGDLVATALKELNKQVMPKQKPIQTPFERAAAAALGLAIAPPPRGKKQKGEELLSGRKQMKMDTTPAPKPAAKKAPAQKAPETSMFAKTSKLLKAMVSEKGTKRAGEEVLPDILVAGTTSAKKPKMDAPLSKTGKKFKKK